MGLTHGVEKPDRMNKTVLFVRMTVIGDLLNACERDLVRAPMTESTWPL